MLSPLPEQTPCPLQMPDMSHREADGAAAAIHQSMSEKAETYEVMDAITGESLFQ
jgi:hypothetical protein